MKNNGHPTSARRLALSRRAILRGVGVSLALPLLEVMHMPTAAHGAQASSAAAAPPRRMFAICNNLGLLPGEFFPKGAGPGYEPSPYLKILQEHRDHFTVFSGVSHPNVDGGLRPKKR